MTPISTSKPTFAQEYLIAFDEALERIIAVVRYEDGEEPLTTARRLVDAVKALPVGTRPKAISVEPATLSNNYDPSRDVLWCGPGLPDGARFAYRAVLEDD